jgi:hypothetical protein
MTCHLEACRVKGRLVVARYYFHIRDREVFIPDDDGMELHDIDAALIEARTTAKEWIAADVRSGRGIGASIIEITDWKGVILNALLMRGTLH